MTRAKTPATEPQVEDGRAYWQAIHDRHTEVELNYIKVLKTRARALNAPSKNAAWAKKTALALLEAAAAIEKEARHGSWIAQVDRLHDAIPEQMALFAERVQAFDRKVQWVHVLMSTDPAQAVTLH